MAGKNMNFAGLHPPFSDYGGAKFAVLPVPYEKTTSYGKGTAKGPQAIIAASAYLELYDEETDANPSEQGIATMPSVKFPKVGQPAQSIRKACSKVYSDGKFPLVLGGEHSISLGCALAAKDHRPDVTVLHFDAHADRRMEYHGTPHSHACVMAAISKHMPAVSVGIRSLSDEEAEEVKRLRSSKMLYFAKDVIEKNPVADIIGSLGGNVYITFDVDAFDPSIMASTGTPEPGGLGWYQALGILSEVYSKRNVIGADIVEFAPDGNRACEFTAAKLAYKMLSYKENAGK